MSAFVPDPKPARKPKRGRTMSALAKLIHARSGLLCERCSRPGEQIHHLAPRGMGGGRYADTLENLVYVCRACHEWIHANPEEARRDGWLRRRA